MCVCISTARRGDAEWRFRMGPTLPDPAPANQNSQRHSALSLALIYLVGMFAARVLSTAEFRQPCKNMTGSTVSADYTLHPVLGVGRQLAIGQSCRRGISVRGNSCLGLGNLLPGARLIWPLQHIRRQVVSSRQLGV